MSKFLCVAALLYGSLIFGCEEGQRIRLSESDCQYAECQGGILVLTNCKSNFLSSSGNHSCEHSGCSNFVKGCEEDRIYSHYNVNRAYYHCKRGRLVSKFCEKEEIFDSKGKKCRQMSSVEKEKNENDILSGIYHDTRYKREIENKCTVGTRRKKEGACKQYYECRGETEILMSCLECENYDEIEKKCRYVFNTPCHHTGPVVEPGTTTCQAEVSPTLPSGHSSSTEPHFSDVHTTEPHYTVEPTTEPHYTTEPTTEPYYTGEHTTEPHYTVEPTTEPHYTGEPTTEPHYTGEPTTEPHYTGEPTTEEQYPTAPTTEPQFTHVSTKEPLYTAPTTEAQNGGTPGNHTPFPTQSADNVTSHPEPIHADCSKKPMRRALESNCKSYLECQNGELVTRKCGWFEHFNSETNACAFSLLVRCDS